MHSVSQKGSSELPRTDPAERKKKDEKHSVTQQMSIINAWPFQVNDLDYYNITEWCSGIAVPE